MSKSSLPSIEDLSNQLLNVLPSATDFARAVQRINENKAAIHGLKPDRMIVTGSSMEK